MSADELIFKLKLEQDLESFEKAEKALTELEKRARKAGKAGGGGGSKNSDAIEKETSVLKQLRAELKNYQNDLSDIQAEAKRTAGATEDNLNVQRALGTAISEVRTQIQEATSGYVDQQTAIDTLPTTYNQLTEQNRALSIAMRNVPLDDTTGRLKQLQEQYAQNNVKLKEFDASMGNFQRNVGDYTGGLRNFASGLAVIQGPLGPIAGRMNALATTIDKLTKSTAKTTVAQTAFSRVMSGNITLLATSATATKTQAVATTVANTAIKGLNITLKALRTALVATGIGALVVGFTALVQFFKRSEDGAQRLRVTMAGFSAIFDVLADRLASLGRFISTAFDNPKQAIIDLGKALVQNVINRFTALPKILSSGFGVLVKNAQATGLAVKGIWSAEAREASRKLFAEAKQDAITYVNAVGQLITGIEDPLTKLIDSVADVSKEISREMSIRKEIERQMNAVLVKERELSLERALQNKELQKARQLARDLEQPAEERLQALRDISKAEQELAEQEIANERKRLQLIQEKIALGETNEAGLKEEVEQQIKLADLERASSERQMSALRDINTVERQIREDRLKQARIQTELFERNREYELGITRDNLVKEGKLAEALQLDLTRIQVREVDERKRLEELYFAELRALKFDEVEAERLAKEKADIELKEVLYQAQTAFDAQTKADRINADKFDRDIALKRTEMLLAFEQERLVRQGRFVEAALLNELDKEKLKGELALQFQQDLEAQGMNADEAARRANEMAEIESEQRIFDAKKRLQDAELEQRLNIAKQISTGLGAINTAFFNDSKEIAVAKAIIDTLAGANAAFAETKGGIFIKSLAAASALSMGYANVRKILTTKIGSKSTSSSTPSAPNISTSFGLVDVGTNSPLASQMAGQAGSQNNQINPTFVFTGDLDPEIMAIKVRQGNNAISGKSISIGM